MPEGLPPLLDGFNVVTRGDAGLPARVCAEHLAMLGARWEPEEGDAAPDGPRDPTAGMLAVRPAPRHGAAPPPRVGVDCAIRWYPRGGTGEPEPPGTEALVQAVTGMMAVHGRDRGVPRRLGLEVASVAAGIVAGQGVLAALVAGSRGRPVHRVETSVTHAALFLLSHHLAIATTPEGLSLPLPAAGPGPPFRTADGHRVEIEVLSFGSWIGFWTQLGVERSELDAAWSGFVHRYLTAVCTLPPSLHLAAGRHTLDEIRRVAGSCGVAVCRVRRYPELIAEMGGNGGEWSGSARNGSGVGAPWAIRQGTGRPEFTATRSRRADAPLAGMRVVEVTSRLQGPLAGLLLRMLGAEVVKVEPPGGDFGRHAPPLAGSLGAAYLAYNRGKRVVEIDYKNPGGRDRLADLAAGADVFLHNWRSGRAEELGLGFDDLAARNPGLVYAHASGWGRDAEEPCPIAGDFLVQAHGACGDGLSPVDEPPFPTRLTILDATGGLLACEGILAGLYLRERSGRGSRVDTSLLGGAMAIQGYVLRGIVFHQERGRRLGRPVWGPLDRPLETADGWLAVDARDEDTRRRLAEACGLGADADDAAVAERLRTGSAAAWEGRFRGAGVPAAVVREGLAGLPEDPRIAGLLERVEDASWMAAAPWRLEG